jgi:hypothetical protein
MGEKYKVRRFDHHENTLQKVVDQNEEIQEVSNSFTQEDQEEDIYPIIDD